MNDIGLLQVFKRGNVRELRNVIERTMIFTQGDFIDLHTLALAPAEERAATELDEENRAAVGEF